MPVAPWLFIPLNPRRFKNQLPKTKYRRQMFTHFHSRLYWHRWHVESAFSQTKRRLGSALRARNEQAQQREGYLRVLTHNLMVLRPSPKRLSTEQALGYNHPREHFAAFAT